MHTNPKRQRWSHNPSARGAAMPKPQRELKEQQIDAPWLSPEKVGGI
jgi:hypothetical protein